jgi:hypothetical protein
MTFPMQGKLKIQCPSQGWKQILTSRQEMLDAYDRAREQAKSHEVETHHGMVAEAACRKWLGGFLPARYGVTCGYVISPGLSGGDRTPHFDVIIYDRLEAPILWIEDDADTSPQGRSRAIPVEHVRAVLEVKAAFSAKTVRESLEHLRDLSPLMRGIDAPAELYKLQLPPAFRCGSLFFELRQADANSEAALSALIDGHDLRGYFGGLILRGEGHTLPQTARLSLTRSKSATESMRCGGATPLLEFGMSKSVQHAEHDHIGSMLMWSEFGFAQFAFDLIAMMQGTYEPGRLSSYYGFGSTSFELMRKELTQAVRIGKPQSTEPAAPPTGGPTVSLEDSCASAVPPSVS